MGRVKLITIWVDLTSVEFELLGHQRCKSRTKLKSKKGRETF